MRENSKKKKKGTDLKKKLEWSWWCDFHNHMEDLKGKSNSDSWL